MNCFELWNKVARNSQCRLPQHFRLVVALWCVSPGRMAINRCVCVICLVCLYDRRWSTAVGLSSTVICYWYATIADCTTPPALRCGTTATPFSSSTWTSHTSSPATCLRSATLVCIWFACNWHYLAHLSSWVNSHIDNSTINIVLSPPTVKRSVW